MIANLVLGREESKDREGYWPLIAREVEFLKLIIGSRETGTSWWLILFPQWGTIRLQVSNKC